MRNRIAIATLAVLIAFTAILASIPATGSCPTVNANNTTLTRILIDRAEGGCVDNRVRFLGPGQWEISQHGAVNMASIVVSGAGSSVVNGTYTERGTFNSRPYYNLTGYPDNAFSAAITWQSAWLIFDENGDDFYISDSDVATPDLASGWYLSNGANPVPTVTALSSLFPPNVFAKQAVKRASSY